MGFVRTLLAVLDYFMGTTRSDTHTISHPPLRGDTDVMLHIAKSPPSHALASMRIPKRELGKEAIRASLIRGNKKQVHRAAHRKW